MPTNQLIEEKSPYLLQHAHNPVDWHAWGERAFRKAREENKPIFLSIGYSTCHWCHVMERESFESEEIAAVLNRYFVPVKVDREERPDVDRIYMNFVQASTGSGGWPMSVWLTPDLKPFYGGTYFPPDNRYGRPGFKYLLEKLAEAWNQDRLRILESSESVVKQLEEMGHLVPDGGGIPGDDVLESCFLQYRRMFDARHGGFGRAPKFPRSVTHNFLLRYAKWSGNDEAADMVMTTLREMAKGGMYDQLGGGFHRYSVDERWFVPHFEKMLYDQGQLALSYLEGYQYSGDPGLANVAQDIFRYVLRDMTHPEGGFYSAEDADSVIDRANPHEKGEGAFYVWTQQEIEDVLGADVAGRFCRRFGVEPNGNVSPGEDPHGEFTGKNILFQAAEVDLDFATAQNKLMEARNRRVRPGLDDKVLTAWNGLMISALAKGYYVLRNPAYLDAAQRAALFFLGRMYDGTTLLRRFREGEAAIPGFLDDYAFLAQGLLDVYEASLQVRYLRFATELTDRMLELFEDKEHGGFYSTAQGDASLVMRMKEDYDGAEPSGNSIAALNLLRLSRLLDREDYRIAAERTLLVFGSRMEEAASGVPQMMVALLFSKSAPKHVVLAGDVREEFHRELGRHFLPEYSVVAADSTLFPWTNTMTNGAYICEDFTCQLPARDVAEFQRLIR